MAEIEKFDPSTLMQGVKDRIKSTFVSLIPDEQWEQMVKNEIDRFFKLSSNNYRSYETSDFTNVVHAELTKYTQEKVKAVLASTEFKVTNDGNGYHLSAMLKDEIMKKAPEIFMSVIQGMIANTLMNMPRH